MTKTRDNLPRVRRTSTTLADGRELIYFDDSEPYRSGSKRRDEVDGRPLDAGPAAGTMRFDALTGDWVSIVDVWADRTRELSAIAAVEHVFCFENRGEEIGVTLHHPHGQIYAYPFVPERTASLLRQAAEHRRRTGRLLGADILAAELEAGSRVVITGAHWTAYVPYAARWPVEVHLAPHRDVPDLVALSDAERDELAEVYLDLLRRLDRFYEGPGGSAIAMPYIAGWHQAPVRRGREDSRLHLQVMSVLRAPGRLKYLAGSESGVGGWVNDVSPERVAARLREVG